MIFSSTTDIKSCLFKDCSSCTTICMNRIWWNYDKQEKQEEPEKAEMHILDKTLIPYLLWTMIEYHDSIVKQRMKEFVVATAAIYFRKSLFSKSGFVGRTAKRRKGK